MSPSGRSAHRHDSSFSQSLCFGCHVGTGSGLLFMFAGVLKVEN
jgi:hypothetical protein